MAPSVGWILNLDADLEFAAPESFRRSNRQHEVTRERGRQFLAIANQSGTVQHVELGRHATPPDVLQSWSPTPFATRAAKEFGERLPEAPPLGVLRAVNHRAFTAPLEIALPGARFVTTMAQLDGILAGRDLHDGWLLKRPFGFSGRGRKHVRGPVRDADRRWAEASMVEYGAGLQVEPFVEIVAEFAMHGFLSRDGTRLTGRPARLRCNPDGSWLGTHQEEVDLTAAESADLCAAHDRAADLLANAGYFGPFATDAYRWSGGFHPLSEINARYTMGWFTGMASLQQAWLDQLRE